MVGKRIGRRAFLARGAAVTGGVSVAAPLIALAACTPGGERTPGAAGDGLDRELVDMGDLALPRGFRFRALSREGDRLDDGSEVPSRFDGMAAFAGASGETILLRNHENTGDSNEIPVVVPNHLRYDLDDSMHGGVTKLVISPERRLSESYALLGGTLWNCAGGSTPWDTWISCEEAFDEGDEPHGYIFEVDAHAPGAVAARPILAAGRMEHEAVAWLDDVLYLTEDQGDGCLYRLVPDAAPGRPGDLAASEGRLEALRLAGDDYATARTGRRWPVGESFSVEWVPIDEPSPSSDTVRREAQEKGGAVFDRTEGIWTGGGSVYFSCTDAGDAGDGQVWELDPGAQSLKLIYESPGRDQLHHPDNILVGPSGELFLCEDNDDVCHIRRLTVEGRIQTFAQALAYPSSEFAGVCFAPDGRTMFVNQQGDPGEDLPGITYAIWGPWEAL
jgi:secreted PhoX family phosphatase